MTGSSIYDRAGQLTDVALDLSRLAARYGSRRAGADPLGAAAALLHDVARVRDGDDTRLRELEALARILFASLPAEYLIDQQPVWAAPRRAAAAGCRLALTVLEGRGVGRPLHLLRMRIQDVDRGLDVDEKLADGPPVSAASAWDVGVSRVHGVPFVHPSTDPTAIGPPR